MPAVHVERIVGGSPAIDNTAQLLADFHNILSLSCSGVVSSKRWVLTNGECILRASFPVAVGAMKIRSGIGVAIDMVLLPGRSETIFSCPQGPVGSFSAVGLKDIVSFLTFVWH